MERRETNHGDEPAPSGLVDGDGPDLVQMPVSSLSTDLSPRAVLVDRDHVLVLAENFESLPPILVQAVSLQIIDGVHRLEAAKLLRHDMIAARLMAATDDEAYLEAIRQNIRHGRPLGVTERRAAAARVVTSHPDWSDRRIGTACGLSPKTVGQVRARATADIPQPRARIGLDNRRHPMDPETVRQEIARLFTQAPEASLRAVARAVDASVATVRRVRDQLELNPGSPPVESVEQVIEVEHRDWREDAAVTATATGQAFAQWAAAKAVSREECDAHADAIPRSRLFEVAAEANRRATVWGDFAAHLNARARHRDTR